jgi:hypothetical protein
VDTPCGLEPLAFMLRQRLSQCVDSHASDAGLGAISPGLSLDALTDGRNSILCDPSYAIH